MDSDRSIRIATFNVALNRSERGALRRELLSGESRQATRVAQIIQLVRPNVLALLELDWDGSQETLSIFHDSYLMRSWSGTSAIEYPYRRQFPSNTGMPVPFDLNADGEIALPEDAQGFGNHEGQYAFSILSQIPLAWDRSRTFQMLLWSSMPGNLMPIADDATPTGIPPDAKEVLRLSSKNHVDVPLADSELHFIIAHPTPPIFDGPERRNSLRNHDEIRLIADYIGASVPENDEWRTAYLFDDEGTPGGLPDDTPFVVLGDMNADPFDGVSHAGAIWQLLSHPRVHPGAAYGIYTPASRGALQNAARPTADLPEAAEHHVRGRGNSSFHTTVWKLRVDYCLPSRELSVIRTGVFWPTDEHQHAHLVQGTVASDHRLVWADIGGF